MLHKRCYLIAVMVMACFCAQAQIENVASIGAVKEKALMDSWTARYTAQNPAAVKGWIYGANALKEMLSFTGTEGIWTFKGVDEKGAEKIVFMAADAKGEILTVAGAFDQSLPCPPWCPPTDKIATIGARIDAALANQWIEAYQRQNKGKIYAHLMGKKIFETVLAQKEAQGIHLAFGLDENSQEHLVIAGVDRLGNTMELTVDQGIICPPFCAKDNRVVKTARN